MPAPLKGALVRETARRESNVNDVAVGILAATRQLLANLDNALILGE